MNVIRNVLIAAIAIIGLSVYDIPQAQTAPVCESEQADNTVTTLLNKISDETIEIISLDTVKESIERPNDESIGDLYTVIGDWFGEHPMCWPYDVIIEPTKTTYRLP
jgi:hypothetical protein